MSDYVYVKGNNRVEVEESLLTYLLLVKNAARNLIEQKGRHNTEIAYKRLEDALNNKG